MTRYLISFDDGWMDHIPDEDYPNVAAAARAIVTDAKALGIWVFSGGVADQEQVSVVNTDLSVIEKAHSSTKDYIGGFTVLELDSHEEAIEWAGRIAIACRCPQEVREILDDPLVTEWLEGR